MTKTINGFRGRYWFLSNFADAKVVYEGIEYPTSEHAFQAAKLIGNKHRREFLREAGKRPGKAKRLGQLVLLRPAWDDIKLGIMLDIVRAKFADNLELQAELLATGEAKLIEQNLWHDDFFGNCVCPSCRVATGQNHLGKILMKVRDDLRRDK